MQIALFAAVGVIPGVANECVFMLTEKSLELSVLLESDLRGPPIEWS